MGWLDPGPPDDGIGSTGILTSLLGSIHIS